MNSSIAAFLGMSMLLGDDIGGSPFGGGWGGHQPLFGGGNGRDNSRATVKKRKKRNIKNKMAKRSRKINNR